MKYVIMASALLSVILLAGCSENSYGTSETSVSQNDSYIHESQAVTGTETGTVSSSSVQVTETEPVVSESMADEEEQTESYKDALLRYYDYLNNEEYLQVLYGMYPESIIDRMIESGQIDKDDLAGEIGVERSGILSVSDVTEEELLDYDAVDALMTSYDQMYETLDILDEYGGNMDALTAEQQEEVKNRIAEMDPGSTEHHYSITEGYDITVYVSDGTEEKEDCFYVFYVENEGWKIQPSMRKYIIQSANAAVKASAKIIFTQFTAALAELEAQGADVSGKYIICSDPKQNINVPSGIDTDALEENAFEYSKGLSESTEGYFILVDDGICLMSAVSEKKGGKIYTQCYPSDEVLDLSQKTSCTMDELYSAASDLLS